MKKRKTGKRVGKTALIKPPRKVFAASGAAGKTVRISNAAPNRKNAAIVDPTLPRRLKDQTAFYWNRLKGDVESAFSDRNFRRQIGEAARAATPKYPKYQDSNAERADSCDWGRRVVCGCSTCFTSSTTEIEADALRVFFGSVPQVSMPVNVRVNG